MSLPADIEVCRLTAFSHFTFTGVGMFSVACFYLWVSTYADSLASTVAIAIGLTVATMGLSIFNQLIAGSNTIEKFLPTSQIASTSFARYPGETDTTVLLVTGIIALAWARLFIMLSKRRLQRA
mgnify:CR=1 FL=1